MKQIGYIDELFDPQKAFEQVIKKQVNFEDRMWELQRSEDFQTVRYMLPQKQPMRRRLLAFVLP